MGDVPRSKNADSCPHTNNVPATGCGSSQVMNVLVGDVGNSGCVNIRYITQPIWVRFDAQEHAPDLWEPIQRTGEPVNQARLTITRTPRDPIMN